MREDREGKNEGASSYVQKLWEATVLVDRLDSAEGKMTENPKIMLKFTWKFQIFKIYYMD